eukprot:Hpha_TRINITY_DN15460_c2_g3::TRINITY_DN15460_c2_g3_i3::g.176473::m.176473
MDGYNAIFVCFCVLLSLLSFLLSCFFFTSCCCCCCCVVVVFSYIFLLLSPPMFHAPFLRILTRCTPPGLLLSPPMFHAPFLRILTRCTPPGLLQPQNTRQSVPFSSSVEEFFPPPSPDHDSGHGVTVRGEGGLVGSPSHLGRCGRGSTEWGGGTKLNGTE